MVYSLCASGKNLKLSLENKLRSINLNCNSIQLNIKFNDNLKLPTFLFILGFFIGDGGIYIRIRKTSNGALNFLPHLILFQKPDKFVIYMFEQMLKSL